MGERHAYSQDELEQYFERICLPASRRVFDVSVLPDDQKFTFLNLLQKHHLVKVPWENLTQHYSWHKVVNVKPKHLFREIVGNPGRGGYCMQANYFYHLILFSLKFDVYMAGSRIYKGSKYGGWTHVVNVITIDGKKYMTDGGFGSQGPTAPLLVEHGVAAPQIKPAEMRVVYEAIPNNLDRSQKVWVYQHRYNSESEWKPYYCFTDLEFTPEDVFAMNFEPWLNKHTFFTYEVAAVRFATSKESDQPGSPGEEALEGEIDSAVQIYHDELKWRRNGKKIVSKTFKTDQERVEALKNYFGILLTEEDQESIKDTAAELGQSAADGLD